MYDNLPSCGSGQASVNKEPCFFTAILSFLPLLDHAFSEEKVPYWPLGARDEMAKDHIVGLLPAPFPCKDSTNSTNMCNNVFGGRASEELGGD